MCILGRRDQKFKTSSCGSSFVEFLDETFSVFLLEKDIGEMRNIWKAF